MDPVETPAPSPERRGGPLPVLLVVLAALVSLAGCRVDATVSVEVDGQGGEVVVRLELDPEAVSVLGGRVEEGADVADLRRAGWVIPPPRPTARGGAVVEARKPFSRPEDLGRVMAELSGPAGPLSGFHFDRRRSLARVRYRLRGVLDLSEAGTVTGLGNTPGLAARLEAAGVDPERVAQLITARAAEGFVISVVVDLPGREPLRWEGAPGDRVEISAASSTSDLVRPALLVVAAVLGAAAIVGARRPT